jgi:hypothetical protein
MVKRAIAALAIAAMSTACIGTSGLTGKVKKFNLTVVENRYGREGVFLGFQLLYVYRVCLALDLLIFNSIEFWTGTNPINGKSALAEVPVSQAEKIGFNEVDRAWAELASDHEAKLHVHFLNGDRMTFDVLRDERAYTVSYMGRVFYEGTIDQPLETADALLQGGTAK